MVPRRFQGSSRNQWTAPVRRRIPRRRCNPGFTIPGILGSCRGAHRSHGRRLRMSSLAGLPQTSVIWGNKQRGLSSRSSLTSCPFSIKFAAPELFPGGSLPLDQGICFLRRYPYGMHAPSHSLSANPPTPPEIFTFILKTPNTSRSIEKSPEGLSDCVPFSRRIRSPPKLSQPIPMSHPSDTVTAGTPCQDTRYGCGRRG